jgi:hypothetical protein
MRVLLRQWMPRAGFSTMRSARPRRPRRRPRRSCRISRQGHGLSRQRHAASAHHASDRLPPGEPPARLLSPLSHQVLRAANAPHVRQIAARYLVVAMPQIALGRLCQRWALQPTGHRGEILAALRPWGHGPCPRVRKENGRALFQLCTALA